MGDKKDGQKMYKQKYRSQWESQTTFKGWLVQAKENPDRAYCLVCKISLRAHKTDLEMHSRKDKHKTNFSKVHPPKTQQLLNVVKVSQNVKKREIILAAYIAIHSSIRTIDHLSNILNQEFESTSSEALHLRRTKCTMLVENVIGATLKEELIKDVNGEFYSVIIDQSTDVSVEKCLSLFIRYFSKSRSGIVTTFLGIINVTECTAIGLANEIKTYLRETGLLLENLIGLGTDGANVLCGGKNSVYTILKESAPKLTIIKCVAHSLHLCCSKAATELPDEMDFLCKQIYNWFSRSGQRRESYKEIFNLININEQVKFHQFVHLSNTRWLERANVLKVILEQWLEITVYFEQASKATKDSMALIIHNMLTQKMFIYFTVAYNIIVQVNIVNASFQETNADGYAVYVELYQLLLTLLTIVIKPIFLQNLTEMKGVCFQKLSDVLGNELSYMPLNILDFGYQYQKAINDTNIDFSDLEIIKKDCRQFVITLCKEIVNRIPTNLDVFYCFKYFNPGVCLNVINRPKFNVLPLEFLKSGVDKQILENQWNSLPSIHWDIPENITSEQFWIQVLKKTNAGGTFIFKDIAILALTVVSLPVSNAFVESVSSFMNHVKHKLRNNICLLENLLRIKCHFVLNEICCNSFLPTAEMYKKFKIQMYNFKKKRQESNTDCELYEVLSDIQF